MKSQPAQSASRPKSHTAKLPTASPSIPLPVEHTARPIQGDLPVSIEPQHALLNLCQSCIGLLRCDGRVVFGNTALNELCTLTNGDFPDALKAAGAKPDDVEQFWQHTLTRTAQEECYEGRIEFRSGKYHAWRIRSTPHREAEADIFIEVTDITSEEKVLNGFQRLITDTGSVAGERYFQTLVTTLASLLQARYVFIGQVDEGTQQVHTMAVCSNGKIIENFTYQLRDTPCSEALRSAVCIYPKDVKKHFPDDAMLQTLNAESYIGIPIKRADDSVVGILVALSAFPLKDITYIPQIMQAFAVRAAMEMVRSDQEAVLHNLTHRLDSQVERLRTQQELLARFYANPAVQSGDFEQVCRTVTQGVSQAFNIGRVSVWMFNQALSELHCFCLYELAGGNFQSGQVIRQADYPEQFKALLSAHCVDADDPYRDPRTRGYADTYLAPNRITAMLDAIIRSGDRVLGAICLEQVDYAHHWNEDEKGFATQLSSLLALTQSNRESGHARSKLLNKEHRLESLIVQSPLGVIEWKLDFTIETWNPAAERIFGWAQQDIRQMSGESLVPEHSRAQVTEVWNNLIRNQGGGFNINENLRKDGKTIICEWHNSTLLDEQGEVVGVVSFVQDVTQRMNDEKERQSSEHKFATIFATSPDAISISELETGRLLEVNRGYEKTSGWKAEEIIGRTSVELGIWINADEREEFIQLMSERGAVDGYEMTFRRKDGAAVQGLLSGRLVTIDGEPRFLAYFHDISELKRGADELRSANKRFEQLNTELDARVQKRTEELSYSVASMKQREFEFGLVSRMQDLLLSCQTRTETFDILQKTANQLFPDGCGGVALYQEHEQTLTTMVRWGQNNGMRPEFTLEDCWGLRQGRMHEVRDTVLDPCCNHYPADYDCSHSLCLPLVVQGRTYGLLWAQSGQPEGFSEQEHQLVITLADVIKLALSNLDLRHALHRQAVRDPLTGLYNRRFLEETLDKLHARERRTGEGYALAIIDIDHFKQLNDRFGHDAGDAALRALSRLMQRELAADATVFRYGGEEFVVVLPRQPLETATKQLEHLRVLWQENRVVFTSSDLGEITMSVGLARAPDHGESGADVIAAADSALYQAKQAGRNRIVTAG